ncbi:hypothetical protein, partial [Bradyrhizobium sp.]|uniref:hypothetical protein n=1 Tax=Bradyrhizobium sp. TaxID=376 RepID=UPI002E09B793|nr:hypothetical protein [Bradyrhizobium sp.]
MNQTTSGVILYSSRASEGISGRGRVTDEETARQWARIQEGLLNLEEYAAALERLMDRNPTAVINPDRRA